MFDGTFGSSKSRAMPARLEVKCKDPADGSCSKALADMIASSVDKKIENWEKVTPLLSENRERVGLKPPRSHPNIPLAFVLLSAICAHGVSECWPSSSYNLYRDLSGFLRKVQGDKSQWKSGIHGLAIMLTSVFDPDDVSYNRLLTRSKKSTH